MKTNKLIRSILPYAVACAIGSVARLHAADPDPREEAIAKQAKAFIEAFHKADAKALAAFWTPDGDYVNENGRVFKGRKAIEEAFAELFAEHKGLALRIDVVSMRFPAPDVAIEDGTSSVIPPDGSTPSRSRYTNVLVRKDGQWLLSNVRETADESPSKYEFLRPLEWVIGDWADDAPGAETHRVSFEWAPGGNFIISTRTVDTKDGSLHHSTQWIGWDAAAKQIRSWSFQADGGFGESTWTKDGGKWLIKSEAQLADGNNVTATHVVTPVDASTITTLAREQKLNGKALPDGKEMKMKRIEQRSSSN